jgi:molybdopterin converting factor small subunit
LAIWERQEGESGKIEPMRWYNRFVVYREMGPDRSLLGAYKLYLSTQKEAETGRVMKAVSAPILWRTAADLWQWRSRAEAWDMENIRRKEAEWAERRKQVQEADFTDGEQLRKLVKEFIELFPQFREVRREENPQPDGTMQVVVTQRVNARLAELATALKAASDLQRVTAGLETERTETKHTGEVAVEHKGKTPWDNLTEAMIDLAVGKVEMAEAEAMGETGHDDAADGNEA